MNIKEKYDAALEVLRLRKEGYDLVSNPPPFQEPVPIEQGKSSDYRWQQFAFGAMKTQPVTEAQLQVLRDEAQGEKL